MKITKEQRKQIVEQYRTGKNCIEIAKQYNVTRGRINDILHLMNEPLRDTITRKLSAKQEHEIIKLYRSGKTSSEIGKIYQTSSTTILSILHINGEKVRPVGSSGRVAKQEKNIIELYRNGEYVADIAKLLNISRETICQVRKKLGEPTRTDRGIINKLSSEQKDNIIQLYRNNTKIKDICKLCNISRNAVLATLKSMQEPKRKRESVRIKPLQSTYVCIKCNIEKPVSEMVKSKYVYNGVRSVCIDCDKEYNRIKSRKSEKTFTIYGITREIYNSKLQKQDNCCAICGRNASEYTKETKRRLAVDHSHITGMVRGLLCQKCNIAIGHLQDSPELLEKAAQYLRSYS